MCVAVRLMHRWLKPASSELWIMIEALKRELILLGLPTLQCYGTVLKGTCRHVSRQELRANSNTIQAALRAVNGGHSLNAPSIIMSWCAAEKAMRLTFFLQSCLWSPGWSQGRVPPGSVFGYAYQAAVKHMGRKGCDDVWCVRCLGKCEQHLQNSKPCSRRSDC